MPDLKIKNVDAKIIQRMDEIVAQKRYTDRSDLIRDILQKHALFGDEIFTNELPETVKILIKDTLSEYPEKFSKLLQFTLNLVQENTALLQKIEHVFEGENKNL